MEASQEVTRAGYSPKTANVTGPQNLVKFSIAKAIQATKDARAQRTQVTADRVVEELAAMGFAQLRHRTASR